MEPRPEVVNELRVMFKDGATPSRLIRHIVERHEGDHEFHQLIQSYFFGAFCVPIVRGLNPVDDYEHADLRFAYLNQMLLHQMIEKRAEWDTDESDSWVDSLNAKGDRERIREAEEHLPPDLKRCWPLMTPKEQRYILVSFASANYLSETVKIMSRLLESLQQQVNELQATPAGAASV